MERIGADVRRELGRFGPAAGMADVVQAWPEVVGEAIARNAWPARIGRDGTLHVSTSSSAWAFELAQLQPELVQRLRHAVTDAPTRLRFAVGRVPEPAADPKPAEKRASQPGREHREAAARLTASIDDEDLRAKVAEAAARSLARAAAGRSL